MPVGLEPQPPAARIPVPAEGFRTERAALRTPELLSVLKGQELQAAPSPARVESRVRLPKPGVVQAR